MTRYPKITNSAGDVNCIRCRRPGETRAAHYCGFRSHSLGKGRGLKAFDIATADFCHTCDDLFSEASYPKWPGGSKSVERSEEFLFWIIMSTIRRLENGVLKT